MDSIRVERYTDLFAERWDRFVLRDSYNGTFLQTRRFLAYHAPGKFTDASIIVYKGNSTVLAVIPACEMYDGAEKVFSSHAGSTFGGIVFANDLYNLGNVEPCVQAVLQFLSEAGFSKIVLKQTPRILAKKNDDLLEYFLYKEGFSCCSEISFVIDFQNYKEDVISNYRAGRRRDYRYSTQNGLTFRKLALPELKTFYAVLLDNYAKFGTLPVHTDQELLDLYQTRLQNEMEFYGVFHQGVMIAGSMVFLFEKQVYHTQYLAAKPEYLSLYPNNFLDTNLILNAKERGFRYFSFGTSTFARGKKLNRELALFKEGYGTGYCNNHIWIK